MAQVFWMGQRPSCLVRRTVSPSRSPGKLSSATTIFLFLFIHVREQHQRPALPSRFALRPVLPGILRVLGEGRGRRGGTLSSPSLLSLGRGRMEDRGGEKRRETDRRPNSSGLMLSTRGFLRKRSDILKLT